MDLPLDEGEFIDIVDDELLINSKKKKHLLYDKIREKNKKYLKNYVGKIKNVYDSKKKELNDKLLHQNNSICKMFDSIYKNGVKQPKIEEITIFQPTKNRYIKEKKSFKSINKERRKVKNLKNLGKVPETVKKLKDTQNYLFEENNNDKYKKYSLPNLKCIYMMNDKNNYISNNLSSFTGSITTWNQLITGYILLFFYFYLILEIRSAIDPIVQYV